MAQSERERWLAESDWLAAHLEDPGVRVVDMRGVVETTTGSDGQQTAAYRGQRDEYLAGHIRGAIFLDWTADIIDPGDPVPAQVAPPARIAGVLGNAGIGDETLVVAYDNHPTSQFATRLWWVLRYYGHDRVKVLNGGLRRWQREGRPLSRDVPRYAPATFTPRPRPEWRATAAEVLGWLHDPAVTLADARDAGQYTNAVRRGPRGGRIPGATNIPREAFVD
ncbi:MAG TPA: rhodanese-like domain-containing protein, partial [Chloroflexota bacterium]|nr:rhodanese-like domain-containing protein [Chloroflexota bacterium]